MNNLVFNDINVNKKKFYESKLGIKLNDNIIKNIVVSNKIKINDKIVKHSLGYIVDDNVILLTLSLTIMSGWIKYFENDGKIMSFRIEDDDVYIKYNNIWEKNKDLLSGIRLNSDGIYNDKYIKTKVKDSKISVTTFSKNIPPEEQIEYVCIPCIAINSIFKIEKKYYPQVYLEQCKYNKKERMMVNLIDYELDSDSDSDHDSNSDNFEE